MSGSSGRRWSGFLCCHSRVCLKDIMERVAKRMTLEELKASKRRTVRKR